MVSRAHGSCRRAVLQLDPQIIQCGPAAPDHGPVRPQLALENIAGETVAKFLGELEK
ncbi:hypothetical protein AB0C95_35380 [Streptomyces caniferus]|uniref:hypothetical protein n=1 Tax=Streptomyces caniferus TaxID=285557 RepID=UPI003400ED4F